MIFLKLKVKIFFIIIIIFFLVTIYNYYFHEVKDECLFSSENVEKSYYLKANKLLKKEGIKLFLYDNNTMKYYEAKRPYEIFYSLVHVSGDIMIAKKQKRMNKKDKVSWALGISREPTYIYIPENKRAVILKRKNQILKNIGTCYLVDNLLGYHVPTKE